MARRGVAKLGGAEYGEAGKEGQVRLGHARQGGAEHAWQGVAEQSPDEHARLGAERPGMALRGAERQCRQSETRQSRQD